VACVLCFRLGTPVVKNVPERRCFLVAKTMVESGEWWVPQLHGEPRLSKPPLYYWAVAATATQFYAGEVTKTALRLPAALCALALVALTFAWGWRIGGAAHGLFAAILLVGMKWFFVLGRRGVAEMPLAFFCIAALFCYERLRATRRAALLPVFALCVALAVLAKATVALLVIGLPIGLDLLLRGEARAALRPRVLAWVGAALVAGFGWYGVVIARVPGAWDALEMALWLPVGIESTVVQNTNTHHHPSLLHYLPLFPDLALPALLLLPLALVRAWRTRFWGGDAARRFPALAFTALFVAFSLFPQKQRHYLLPLLPLLALVLAEPLAYAVATWPDAVRRWLRLLGPLAAAGGALLLAVFTGFYAGLLEAPALQIAALLALGGAAIAGCALAGLRGRVVAFAACCAVGWLGATAVVRLDYEIHRSLYKHGQLALRSDDAARRWQHAFERLDRLEDRFSGRQLGSE